jgi:hypothetical protein
MSQQPAYFLNLDNGDVFLTENEIPKRRGQLYMVVNRQQLSFHSFSVKSKKKIKDNQLVNIQRNFVPFQEPFLNIIFGIDTKQEKQFFFWIGNFSVETERFYYDEVPETLVFKGDPQSLKHYDIFVFQRISGFEIIYLQNNDFFTIFETESGNISEQILFLSRKFSRPNGLEVCSEVEISSPPSCCQVHSLENKGKLFYLPDYFPLRKRFSNISRSKQVRNVRNIVQSLDRSLTLVAVLLLVFLLACGGFYFYLQKDQTRYREKFSQLMQLQSDSERVEFGLNRIRRKIAGYPDHMRYLKTVCEALDQESFLTSYTLEGETITLEGFSRNSLDLLARLRKSKDFKEVTFKSTVRKNIYSQKEKFDIEIIIAKTI